MLSSASLRQDDEPFSFTGESSWCLGDGFVTPKPRYGRPILVNTTGSEARIAFAGRYSDIVFVTSPAGADIDSALAALPDHTARVKAAARGFGREIRMLINPLVICRETEAEVWAYADAIVAHADPRTLHKPAEYKIRNVGTWFLTGAYPQPSNVQ